MNNSGNSMGFNNNMKNNINMNQMNNLNMMNMNNNMNPQQQRDGDIFDRLFNPALLNDQQSMFSQNNNNANSQNNNQNTGVKNDPFSNLVNLMK